MAHREERNILKTHLKDLDAPVLTGETRRTFDTTTLGRRNNLPTPALLFQARACSTTCLHHRANVLVARKSRIIIAHQETRNISRC